MTNVLDALPSESSAVIAAELTVSNPALLEQLRSAREPTLDQRAAVNQLLARAVIKNMGSDWTPTAHGLAVERAVKAFLEKWPIHL